jgi:hypothetical protein
MSAPCPCGLTREEVLALAEGGWVPLTGGYCQNPSDDGICGKRLGAHPSAQAQAPQGYHRNYVLDMDGTIVYRGPALRYPTNEKLPGHLLEGDDGTSAFFEGRPVYFGFEKKSYPIWFRRGVYTLLQELSQDGDCTIYLATHACKVYAERVARYLERRVNHLKIRVLNFSKMPLVLKSVNFRYEFIIDDKPQRWVANTERLVSVPSFDDTTVDSDLILMGLAACLHHHHRLPDDVISMLGEFLNDAVNPALLRYCARCKRHCLAGVECDQCGLNDGSDTEAGDSFEKEETAV